MHLVRIEFHRVQTFLFAAPRLRDMVGGNVLLGEALRIRLPKLARRLGAAKISGLTGLPSSDSSDPLSKAAVDDRDDPARQYNHGILARDGGHFQAVFNEKDQVERFSKLAEALLLRDLPGLRFSLHAGALVGKTEQSVFQKTDEQAILDLPQFEVCQAIGNGPAEDERAKDSGEYVSRAIQLRRAAYKRFRDRESHDIVGLIDSQLPDFLPPPEDFKDMCGEDYMAVILADGNDIGRKSTEERGERPTNCKEADILAWEAKGECFFHATRLAVRKAVVGALNKTFSDPEASWRASSRPYQLLMLGGDDLLLVCRAKAAMKFLVDYADRLRQEPGAPTIGAGVVIAPPNVPFHHLHHLAEVLAGSAKRFYRLLKQTDRPVSVADWLIVTGSWSGDPIELRRRTALVLYKAPDGATETLALTRRPLPILDFHPPHNCSLESLDGLVKAAANLDCLVRSGKLARSQLRRLVDALPHGRSWSQTIFDEWKEKIQGEQRDAALVQAGLGELWVPAATGMRQFTTSLADLVEIFEIGRLATAG